MQNGSGAMILRSIGSVPILNTINGMVDLSANPVRASAAQPACARSTSPVIPMEDFCTSRSAKLQAHT